VLSRWRAMARALFHRKGFEDGLAEEMRFHLEQYTHDLIAAGHSPEEAARRARIEFGSMDNVTLDCREARGLRAFDMLQQRVRYAARILRKHPAFTVTALATLAITVGANLAIFAIVDAVLLRPLPFPDPSRLVAIYNTYPRAGVPDDGATVTNYYERRHAIDGLVSVSLYRDGAAIVGEAGATEREYVTRVTPDFFETLGVPLALGHGFTEADTQYGESYSAGRVVVVTDGYWRNHLAGDPHVVGRAIRLDGERAEIVGVLPQGFRFLSSTRGIYLPLASGADERGPNGRHAGSSSHMVARLRPGLTIAQVQAQIDAHNATVERTDPQAAMIADAGFRSLVIPLRDVEVASVRPTLLLLEAGVLGLLLIGGVNVANLFLIRASSRSREFALRQAIGADRRHVIAEAATESVLLTLSGGVLGLAVGAGGIRLLRALGASRLPLADGVALDGRAALAALAASLVLGVAIAVPLAWCSLRSHAADTLGADSRTTTAGRAAQRLRHAFLVVEVALAFVLLAGSGLLALSLQRVTEVDPGFHPEQVLSGQVALPWTSYQDAAKRLTFMTRLLDALSAQPGVAASGISTNVPFSGNTIKAAVTVAGYVPPPGVPVHAIVPYAVRGDYFRAMGIPLLEGRLLTRDDDRLGNTAVVVDENFARFYFPRGGAIGHHVQMGTRPAPSDPIHTIVGVVGAVKQDGLTSEESTGAVYYAYDGRFDNNVFVVARTTGDADALAAAMRRLTRQIDPELPVNNLSLMTSRVDRSLMTQKSPAVLATIFAGIAVLLTAVGMYGVLGYAVALRRREIGLRMALGAQPGHIRRAFVGMAARLLMWGGVAGLAGALATGRAMSALLFRVDPVNWPVLGATTIVLGVVCLAACFVPSWRAARISPAKSLADL
jgi:predicted permease